MYVSKLHIVLIFCISPFGIKITRDAFYEISTSWPAFLLTYRKWQDYVYIQCEYKSTKQKIKHLLREENKVKENKIS